MNVFQLEELSAQNAAKAGLLKKSLECLMNGHENRIGQGFFDCRAREPRALYSPSSSSSCSHASSPVFLHADGFVLLLNKARS